MATWLLQTKGYEIYQLIQGSTKRTRVPRWLGIKSPALIVYVPNHCEISERRTKELTVNWNQVPTSLITTQQHRMAEFFSAVPCFVWTIDLHDWFHHRHNKSEQFIPKKLFAKKCWPPSGKLNVNTWKAGLKGPNCKWVCFHLWKLPFSWI